MEKFVHNNIKKIYESMHYYFNQYRFKLGLLPKKSRDQLRNYWMSPSDTGNRPEAYARNLKRSEFLGNLVKSLVPQPRTILEIGCNVGRNLDFLRGANYQNLTGIELSTPAVEEMKRYFPDLAASATIINAPVESVLPGFKDRQFDLVYTMAVLVHIPPESESIFSDIARIAGQQIITIEDEQHHSIRHFPRNYNTIFVNLGFHEIAWYDGDKMAEIGLPRDYVARVFQRIEKV